MEEMKRIRELTRWYRKGVWHLYVTEMGAVGRMLQNTSPEYIATKTVLLRLPHRLQGVMERRSFYAGRGM